MNILVNTSMGISTMKCLGVGSLHHRLCVSKILGDTVFQSATNLLHSLADYEHFYAIIRNLEKEKEDNLEEIINLKQEIRNLKTNVEIVKATPQMPSSGTSLDVLKRLSRLEKVVYGTREIED